jgi:tetratricopeptide (TPR) repeat protein
MWRNADLFEQAAWRSAKPHQLASRSMKILINTNTYSNPLIASRTWEINMNARKLFVTASTTLLLAASFAAAQHMPTPIYAVLGVWEESIKANQAAFGTAKNHPHAVDIMVYAHLQLGQDREAQRLVAASAVLQKGWPAALRTSTGAVLFSYTAFAAAPARVAIERGSWAEAAALTLRPTTPAGDAITHFTRAIGMARLRDTVNARHEIDALQKLTETLLTLNDAYWAEQVDIQRTAAMAWVAYAEGKLGDALKLMCNAADREDASEKHVAMENRLWPMRELLADLLLELKQPGPALTEYERSLEEYPNRLRAFSGAARAADASGDRPKAAAYYEKLAALTAKADPDKKEAQEAKAFLAVP